MNAIQQKIHNESLKILDKIGFKVVDQRILNKLVEAGFRTEGTTVYFTEEQIKKGLSTAPKSFTIRARNPKKDVTIGEGETKLAAGYGCTFVHDRDGNRRNAVLDDYIKFAKLVHHSDCFGVNGGILVQPYDLETKSCFPTMLYTTIFHSDMPLLGFSSHESDVRHGMELAEIAFGGHENFCSDYHLLTLVNLMTPLQLGDFGEQSLWVAAEYNQPVILTPGVSAGGTAPVTPAGLAAVGNAEILAAVAISQLLRPGLPVVYGLNGSVIDMQSSVTRIATPLSEQVRTLGRQMAVSYGLPSRNAGGLSDAKKAGIQSTFEGLFCLLNSIKENTSISLHSAGILDSFMAMSYEKFMIDCETIRTIRKACEPVDISEDALDFDDIEEVGIGGNYLASMNTVMNFREFTWKPEFCAGIDVIKEDPAQADILYMDRVQALCQKWLADYKRPELDPEINAQLVAYLTEKLEVSQSVIDQIVAG